MTLWKCTADGIALCAIAVGALVVSGLLLRSGVPALETAGGIVGVLAYGFSFPLFGLGVALIVGGVAVCLMIAWKRRKHDA